MEINMDKYQKKYRIHSTRLPDWNYGNASLYFITICTQKMVHFFGEIEEEEIILSDIGDIVKTEWLKTFMMRPDMNLWIGEFIIMPNHFHAIIGIGGNVYNTENGDAKHGDAKHRVSTIVPNQFGPQSKNLASIIRGFKSSVSILARKTNLDFHWQTRFYDHIIRNDKSFQTTSSIILPIGLKINFIIRRDAMLRVSTH
jgi:REP element-mobilizing transposase RayT